MNRTNLAIMCSLLMGTGNAFAADEMLTFSSGDYIKADEINQNFSYLKALAESSGARGLTLEDEVDCTSNSEALAEYFAAGAKNSDFLVVTIKGNCSWGSVNFNRSNIEFAGHEQGGQISGNIRVDSEQKIGFVNLTINDDLIYDGNANGWVDNLTGDGDNMISVGASSRLWYGDGTTNIRRLEVTNGSALSGSYLDVNSLYVDASTMAAGEIVADEIILLQSASLSTWTEEGIDARYIGLRLGSSLQTQSLSIEENVDVTEGSSLSVEYLTLGGELGVNSSSSVGVHTELVSSGNIIVTNSSSMNAGSLSAPQLFLQHSSSASIASLDVDLLFCRTSSMYNDQSFTVPNLELGGFCYLEAHIDMTSLCDRVDTSGSVLGWSTVEDVWNSFPADCTFSAQ
ncbi:hypothetical protein AB4343_17330 [Vibrio breoganii]|uniref:Polymer-forming cytoskeletal protein n=2 Tax=Vibrio breoganii TaxID=553239 RepID=A0AAP8MW72_9VIBR|nr:hypothetical protein [Vibrio breoganii]NMO75297.1 hypothetical protein [Vibrio breoganii]NMR71834.1 hypothetical protein [Vibrio breoganii]OED96454.1 hypothetical protein A1QG_14335 [Vibrio breoganii ZF-29]PMG02691.1 hypothetical protein BCV02_10820 [Vibrio breoganii]PMH22474.1 hypothetical protein BCU74_00105 [Vibrio breoganii]